MSKTNDVGETDLNKLALALSTLPDEIRAEAIAGLVDIGNEAAALAKMFVRVDTGALRDSIKSELEGETVKVSAGGTAAPHAKIIEVKYPYLAPAIEAIKPQMDALVERINMKVQERVNSANTDY